MTRPIATGNTQLLGIIGHPIAQVRAPEVWSALFKANGFDHLCIPMHVQPEDLGDFLTHVGRLQNLAGLIVTIPHKPAALSHVRYPTDRARLTGAVNVLRPAQDGSWAGDALDGMGFVSALAAQGRSVKGLRAVVVGSGGVGTSIAIAIAEAGAAEVSVADVAADRAADLSERIRSMGVTSSVVQPKAAGFDLVVNASPVGMRPDDPMPVDLTGISSDMIVADVVVHPRMTRHLTAAAEAGCFVQCGDQMMDAQLAHMASFFGFDTGDWSPQAVAAATL
ncbi:shikimate dehydrogenase [Streptomyces sp. GESEQ-35]|uniref:shikimate dehydrogenase family protein n=1 Tax=Streptomyces sp. GESEQ-35 TaxID=2812657 RepID=UPI001FF45787|nr:shikimate dehydrogenase [Streptomyces sp. GESEQ-35]